MCCFQALSLDPRSPSGLPRTPIVVEEEEVEQEDALSADLEEEDDKKTQSLKPKVVPKRNMIHDFRDVK